MCEHASVRLIWGQYQPRCFFGYCRNLISGDCSLFSGKVCSSQAKRFGAQNLLNSQAALHLIDFLEWCLKVTEFCRCCSVCIVRVAWLNGVIRMCCIDWRLGDKQPLRLRNSSFVESGDRCSAKCRIVKIVVKFVSSIERFLGRHIPRIDHKSHIRAKVVTSVPRIQGDSCHPLIIQHKRKPWYWQRYALEYLWHDEFLSNQTRTQLLLYERASGDPRERRLTPHRRLGPRTAFVLKKELIQYLPWFRNFYHSTRNYHLVVSGLSFLLMGGTFCQEHRLGLIFFCSLRYFYSASAKVVQALRKILSPRRKSQITSWDRLCVPQQPDLQKRLSSSSFAGLALSLPWFNFLFSQRPHSDVSTGVYTTVENVHGRSIGCGRHYKHPTSSQIVATGPAEPISSIFTKGYRNLAPWYSLFWRTTLYVVLSLPVHHECVVYVMTGACIIYLAS